MFPLYGPPRYARCARCVLKSLTRFAASFIRVFLGRPPPVNSIGEPEASRIWSTGRSLFPRDLRRARFVPVSGVSTRYHEEEEGAA